RVGDRDMVNNTKQTFQACEPYAELEDWLGGMLDMYCRENSEDSEGGSSENSEASEGGSSANSERPHVRFNIPVSPKQPAAEKSLNSAGRNTTSTSTVRTQGSEGDSSATSERPHVVHNIPKVPKAKRGRPKLTAAEKASNYARRNSTSTINMGRPKLTAAEKASNYARRNSTSTINMGLQRCEANLGLRKRFTRSSLLCSPTPRVTFVLSEEMQ
ncbi:hypothetical protein MKW92_038614, partial [Papaver armeniacum]